MIIIPARLQSTRLSQKVLRKIGNLPMVVLSAKNASKVDEVIVACDDDAIMQACRSHHIKCVMTDKNHTSGTDRCAEAARILGLDSKEIIINLQADEPFIESHLLETLKTLTLGSGAFMNTLAKEISSKEVYDANLVKVVLNANNEALYFSRLGIPYFRDGASSAKNMTNASTNNNKGLESSDTDSVIATPTYLGHLGIYGFLNEYLQAFCALPKSPLEDIEKLEQLRALYYGKKIALSIVQTQSIGIDTQEDLERAIEKFKAESP